MKSAPIALFAYNRPRHLRATVEALKKNELAGDSMLFVFSDGPANEIDAGRVSEVRAYLKTLSGFHNVEIILRERNQGLARSIISGVGEIVGSYGRIIVLEDDMVTSPFFLRFMNEALEFYRENDLVIGIHGYIYPVRSELPETFFLRGADCWGWATWKRGWDLFEPDGQKLLAELKEKRLRRSFDLNGAYPYTRMLEDQIRGKNDSWAIRWHASAFLRGKFTLYPGKSLVQNIGTDDSGRHCVKTRDYDIEASSEPVNIRRIPVEENRQVLRSVEEYFRSIRPSLIRRLLRGPVER